MNQQRILLLVEDGQFQYKNLKREFEEADWLILHATDAESTLRLFDQMIESGKSIDAIALDLGLPPDIYNPLKTGIPLIYALRQRHSQIPIMVYTSLAPKDVNYSLIITRLLPLRVSFITLRQIGDGIELAYLLEMVYQGFVILSPDTAEHLPKAIATKPDPLNAQQWRTLRELNKNLTYQQIANALSDIKVDAVKTRLKTIGERLVETGEILSYEATRDDLVNWYRLNRVRYCRE